MNKGKYIMTKISVIIPIYNSGRYLKETLNSVQQQTFTDIEIILVDDGSRDNSLEIMNVFLASDQRFRIIQIQHQGANEARRIGTEYAASDYIFYMDSDDLLDKEYLQKMMDEYDGDIVIDRTYCTKLGGQKKTAGSIPEGIYMAQKDREYLYQHMIVGNGQIFGVWPSLSGKIFRKQLLLEVYEENGEREIYYGEDRNIIYQYLLKCAKIKIVNIGGYYYIKRPNSATTSVHEDYLINVGKLYLSLKNVFENHYLRERLIEQLQKMITDMIKNATVMMGFENECRDPRYGYSGLEIEKNAKIILYGAGIVGKDYYKQIVSESNYEIAKWVDQSVRIWQQENIQIYPVESILECKYDYILIAIMDDEVVDKIMRNLNDMGIEKKKIIWKRPIRLMPFL